MDITRKDASTQYSNLHIAKNGHAIDEPHICEQCAYNRSLNPRKNFDIQNVFTVTLSETLCDAKTKNQQTLLTNRINKILPSPIRKSNVRQSDSSGSVKRQSLCQSIESLKDKSDALSLKEKQPAAVEMKNKNQKNNIDRNPIVDLGQLENLLCRIFRGENLSISDFELNPVELHILVEVFIRKNKSIGQIR